MDTQRRLKRRKYYHLHSVRAIQGKLPCLVRCRNSRRKTLRLFIRQCSISDLDQIMALQGRVIRALPNIDTFVPSSRAELTDSLENDFCICAIYKRKIIMFSSMIINRVTPRQIGASLGYNEDQLNRCVTYDATFVDPTFRGYGLQNLAMWFRDNKSISLGVAEALVTVSPKNPASYQNIRAAGFRAFARQQMYHGVDRIIMRKTFGGSL